jgi:hydrogenase nickel incorporation protein HypA/HybF
MHELSIAVSIVDVACEELSRLGSLSGVVKDALVFSFEAAALGTPLNGARLQIEEVPVTVWCGGCSAERVLDTPVPRRCPVCHAVTPDILRGEELELIGLEVVDA